MRRHSPKAFTLVELLVVVSIIALLISILLPALQRARELARAVACASNVRQSVLSMITYSSDYGGMLTPFQDVGFEWYQEFGGNWSGPAGGANDGGHYWFRLLRHYKYGSGTFMCPSGTNISWYNHPSPPPTTVRPWDPTFSIEGYQTNAFCEWYLEDRDGDTTTTPAPDRTNYGSAASYNGNGWNFSSGVVSASGIQWITQNWGRMGVQEMLPMVNFWPYGDDANANNYNGSSPTNVDHSTAEVLAAIRKPTVPKAYKPGATAVIFDGLFNLRFDKNFWGYISLRHHNKTAASFAFMDGHSETRDWTRLSPGERFAGSGRHFAGDPLVNPPLPFGHVNQLRNLLDTAIDGTAVTDPRATHSMRFVVPKVVFNDSAGQPAGD